MCRTVHWLAVGSLCLFPLVLRAQDRAEGAAKKGEGASPAVIAIDVVIADVGPTDKAEAAPDDKDVPAQVRDLEKQGKLARLTRMHLTTLSERRGTVQFGERFAMVTGRTFAGGRGVAGGGGAGEAATAYSYQNIGTQINLIPRVEEGKVFMECSFDCTRIAPRKPAADKPEGTFEPTSLETIQITSMVTVKSGETALLASKQSSGPDGITRTYVLVTATIQDPGRKDAAVLKVYTLAHAKAGGVADTLARVFGDKAVKLSADERSNSVVAKGSEQDLEVLEALLQRLDDR